MYLYIRYGRSVVKIMIPDVRVYCGECLVHGFALLVSQLSELVPGGRVRCATRRRTCASISAHTQTCIYMNYLYLTDCKNKRKSCETIIFNGLGV